MLLLKGMTSLNFESLNFEICYPCLHEVTVKNQLIIMYILSYTNFKFVPSHKEQSMTLEMMMS